MQTIEEKAKINYPENSENNAVNLSQKRQQKAFIKGFLNAQKDYEEKLRWIPVIEKMPENLEWVDCKSGVGDHYVGCYLENYGIKTGKPATITHWRSFL